MKRRRKPRFSVSYLQFSFRGQSGQNSADIASDKVYLTMLGEALHAAGGAFDESLVVDSEELRHND